MTATEIAATVTGAELSAVEVTQEALRLAETEGKELNAFITLCHEKALKQAHAVDKKITTGKPVGALAGVPVALKDNICYRDYPTTCASRILHGVQPPYDATAVARLIAAGAVIVGKTNLDEFGMGSSNETSCYGPVKNPHDGNLIPGGSSGGSAAAVARGIVPVALGSDTGGSVRQPASFCGILGLKPTYGAVSRYGLVAYGSSLEQIGFFAKTVKDLVTVFKVACGHDPLDATSVAFDHPDYPQLCEESRKFTIGIPREYFTEGLDPEVESQVKKAIGELEAAGHSFVEVSLPLTDKAIAAYYIIATAEASSNLARYDGVRYGRRDAEGTDLFEMYCRTRSAGFGREVKRRIMLGTFVLSSGYYDDYYLKASRVRELIRRDFERIFRKVDLIITPTTPTPPFKLGEKVEDPLTMYLSDVYTVSANLAGIPAISVPYGRSSDGRPIDVQFMAAHFGELSLFQIARQMEALR
jgi:aspartyl-tRNA(Asn)/glutamyl-tRNA(Gln) amidotransferase subunit A